MADKLIGEIKLVQSSWTRGICNTIMHGRTDTDILVKSAHEIDNMIIMQQGGLTKRPCTKLLRDLPISNFYYSFAIQSPDGINCILVQQQDGDTSIFFTDSDKVISIGKLALITNYVQDQNVILVTPAWKNITIDFTKYSAEVTSFAIKHQPLAVNQITSDDIIYITKEDTAGKDKYFSVGDKVLLFHKAGDVIKKGLPSGTAGAVFINGLYVEYEWIDPALTKTLSGSVIYGSSVNAIADAKVTFEGADYWGTSSQSAEVGYFKPAWGGQKLDNLPKYISIFQNRLWCAGVDGDSKTLWASAIGDMHDFRQTTTDDDAPISLVISGSPVTPRITGIYSGITISVFTDIGVYAFVNQLNTSITPTNFFIQRQNGHSCADVLPIEYDQQLVYVQANNSNIRSLQYTQTALLTDNNLTILCPDIIHNPLQMAVTNSLDGSDNAYLFVLNDDSSILCFQSVATQAIAGWSRWTFDFKIIKLFSTVNNRLFAVVVKDSGYAIVEFKHGIYKDHNATTPKCTIQTTPFGLRDMSIGDLLFTRKKVSKIKAYVYLTDEIIIEDQICSVNHFDEEYTEIKTGVLEVVPDSNFETLNQVTISHHSDSPFALLSLQVKLDIGSA